MSTTTTKATGKVLVLGDDTRSFLATVRSLGRQGLEVHAAPFDFGAPALRSRYLSRIHFLPYYLDGGADWLDEVRALFERERYDLVIPCEERALLPLVMHRDELEPLCRLAIPDAAALKAFFDKEETRALATRLGIPVARGRLMRAGDSAAGIAAELGLPLIAKPRRSFTWPDVYVRKSARLLETEAALQATIVEAGEQADEVLLESLFPGEGLGVSVLCREGKVLQSFEHRRAHELFGSSFYRRSVAVDPKRLAAVEAMAAAVNYTGLAMFEFKLNTDTGEWILLEVNARPWGSLPLPVSIGVDFPYGLYRVLVKGESPAAVSYPVDRYARNFIPDLWQMRSRVGEVWSQPLTLARQLLGWGWGFRRRLLGTESHDVSVADDREPARAEMRQFLRERSDSLLRRQRPLPPLAQARARLQDALARGEVPQLVFLCQGNICRSPYAELRLRALLGDRYAIRISSAGMLPRNRRPSPERAREAAGKAGLDLTAHRSQHAQRAMVESATLIIAFDDINLRSYTARYPELLDRFFLLGSFAPAGVLHIVDPEGRSADTFGRVYAQIDVAVAALAREVEAAFAASASRTPAKGEAHA